MADKSSFYLDDGDFTFHCKDGDLTVSKTMLNERSIKFKEFMTPNKKEYDIEVFKTFLDLALGFEKFTRDKALIIFPIVHKNVPDLLPQCVSFLKPTSETELDEMVIGTLNVVIEYDCEELIDAVIDFLVVQGINRLFFLPEYYLLLKPNSVAMLLRFVRKSPVILKAVVHWGREYLIMNNLDVDLQSFFKNNHIMNKLSLDCLETYDSVLQLYDPDPKKKAFSDEEILKHLKKTALLKRFNDHEWVTVKPNETLTENFYFIASYLDFKLSLRFSYNQVVYDEFAVGENNIDNLFNVSISIFLKNEAKADKGKLETAFNIFPSVAMYHTKSSINAQFCNMKTYKAWNPHSICDIEAKLEELQSCKQLTCITFTYKFFKTCKILKTLAKVPQLRDPNDQKKLYFTCGIEFKN